jgi:hypothetical protein
MIEFAQVGYDLLAGAGPSSYFDRYDTIERRNCARALAVRS